jgi:hypothetical protein
MMSIAARDMTGNAFDQVEGKMDKLAMTSVRAVDKIGMLAMQFATFGRITGLLNDEQAKMIGIFGAVINVLTTGYYVAKMIATAITWAHNVALTWEVALMTLGIGVAIAAAAAIAILASQTQSAAVAQKNYNVELEKGTTLQERRTASQRLVRRGEYEEVLVE